MVFTVPRDAVEPPSRPLWDTIRDVHEGVMLVQPFAFQDEPMAAFRQGIAQRERVGLSRAGHSTRSAPEHPELLNSGPSAHKPRQTKDHVRPTWFPQ